MHDIIFSDVSCTSTIIDEPVARRNVLQDRIFTILSQLCGSIKPDFNKNGVVARSAVKLRNPVHNVFLPVPVQGQVTVHLNFVHMPCGVIYLPFPTGQYSSSHNHTTTTGKVKECKAASERQKDLKKAGHGYIAGLEPSILSPAQTYGVPFGTLRGCLQGTKPSAEAHSHEQILSVKVEKAIVRFCVLFDDLGHPLRGSLVKAFAIPLLPPAHRRQLSNHWLTRFLNRNPAVASKFSQRLDRQRANASNS